MPHDIQDKDENNCNFKSTYRSPKLDFSKASTIEKIGIIITITLAFVAGSVAMILIGTVIYIFCTR